MSAPDSAADTAADPAVGAGRPWPVGAATGVGSLPGTDIVEAVRTVAGELPDLPYLPELPARGPGAGMIGRTAGLLVGLPVDLYVGRWRMTARPGIDVRRIADLLERDLDALTDVASDYAGPVKIQAAGPWTLAAGIDRQTGGAVLGDHGAVRDLAASLAEGLAAHAAEVGRRVPGARVLLQLDEPGLPAVLAGRVRTESGLYTLRAVSAETARSALRQVIGASGAVAVGLDLALLGDLDPLGEAVDGGLGLFAGAVPTSPPARGAGVRDAAGARDAAEARDAAGGGDRSSDRPGDDEPGTRAAGLDRAAAERVLDVWRKLGFPLKPLPEQVVVTPACGLAGASPAYARAATTAVREAARRLVDAALG
ncbi:MAG TPA: methionine synthase [Rugosimonospora sp.]|nr:methionine synthase [Rugosimonospora sp.]